MVSAWSALPSGGGQGNDEFLSSENLPATLPPGGIQGVLTLTLYNTAMATDDTNAYRLLGTYITVTNQGYIDSPAEVPVLAAAWLFGSALLGLGAMKRRKA